MHNAPVCDKERKYQSRNFSETLHTLTLDAKSVRYPLQTQYPNILLNKYSKNVWLEVMGFLIIRYITINYISLSSTGDKMLGYLKICFCLSISLFGSRLYDCLGIPVKHYHISMVSSGTNFKSANLSIPHHMLSIRKQAILKVECVIIGPKVSLFAWLLHETVSTSTNC